MRKRLFLFMLTLVGMMLLASPPAVAQETSAEVTYSFSLGEDPETGEVYPVYFIGGYYMYKQKNAQGLWEDEWKDPGSFDLDKAPEMLWNPAEKRYEIKIRPTEGQNTIYYKFLFNKLDWNYNGHPGNGKYINVSPLTAPVYGNSFGLRTANDNQELVCNQGDCYVVYLKDDGNGQATYAIAMTNDTPDDALSTYTCTVDICALRGNHGWGTGNVYAHFAKSDRGLTVWPGVKAEEVDGRLTLTLESPAQPDILVFNNNNAGAAQPRPNQSVNIPFVNGKTYYLNWGNGQIPNKDDVSTNVMLVDYEPTEGQHRTYTVKVDLSKISAGFYNWSTQNVHAHFGEITSWPGVAGEVGADGIVTFSASACYEPTCIVFNDGYGGPGRQTVDLVYEEGKTYVLHKKNYDMLIEDWGTDKEILIYGTGYEGACMRGDAGKSGVAMTWNAEKERYEAKLTVSDYDSFAFNFWFDGAYRRPVQPQAATPVGRELSYSDAFEDENAELMDYDIFANHDVVGIYLYQDINTGTPCYAVQKVVEGTPVFTFSIDLSTMGKRKWNPAETCAFFKDSNKQDMHDWPGLKHYSVSGDVVTFQFENEYMPSYVIFNDGLLQSPGGTHQSQLFPFENGKTYVLSFTGGNWAEGSPTVQLPKVNLPYGPDDFAEPKYFLVGTRQGSWHLQPEWEFIKQANGTYKIKGGRFLRRGNFAIARVNTYTDYIYHYYDLYSKLTGSSIEASMINDKGLLTITGIEDQEERINGGAQPYIANAENYPYFSEHPAEMLAMTLRLNGPEPEDPDISLPTSDNVLSVYDIGTWSKSITLTPTGNGKFSLTFDFSDPKGNENRIFTLVGSDVYHRQFSGAEGFQTPRNSVGWQESWIQYDSKGKPYYDANNEYLYHTAYTRKIFEENEVKFQINIPDGYDDAGEKKTKPFDYTSSSIAFFEASQLDLTNDIYAPLYEALAGKKDLKSGMVISGGDPRDNTDFAFRLGTIPTEVEAANADWKVYVVRDAWVSGQFKIWSGWGGNSISLNCFGSSDSNADWIQLNGGPSRAGKTGEDKTSPVLFTNIEAGAEGAPQAINPLYENQGANYNYKLDDLTYFSRIIFLYNEATGESLSDSYAMFIQGDNQPVIQAFVEGAEQKGASATWELVNVNLPTDALITGYSLYRYSVTDEGNVNPVKIQGATGLTWSIADLSTYLPATYHEPKNLAPGSYRYYIKVYYSTPINGEIQTAWRDAYSNTITIYGDEINPDLRVEQLVALNRAGFEAIGAGELFASDGTPAEYAPDRFYLTYRNNNPKADYFALMAGTTAGENRNISFRDIKMKEVEATKAIAVLADPDLYVWVSRFYVRALDYTAFRRHYNQQFVPFTTPNISLKDCAADAESKDPGNKWSINAANMATNFMDMTYLDGTTSRYIGTIVDRQGLLLGGDMEASMHYTFGVDNIEANTSQSVAFEPVVPQPYNLKYRYDYRAIENGSPVKDYILSNPEKIQELFGENAELDANFEAYYQLPVRTTVRPASTAVGGPDAVIEDPNTVEEVYINEANLANERHLDCLIEFTRPNVSQNIFDFYTVFYKFKLTSEMVEGAELTEQEKLFYTPGSEADKMSAWYFDPFEDTNNNGLTPDVPNNPYSIRITDTHPSGSIFPRFEIEEVYFVRKADLDNASLPFEDKHKLLATHQYVKGGLIIDAVNNTTSLLEIEKMELSFNPENLSKGEGLQWFLCRHSELSSTASPADAVKDVFEPTKHFLVELTDGQGGYGFSKNLWYHDHPEFTDKDVNGLYSQQPFYVASIPFSGDEIPVPDIKLTPVYLYYRNLTDGNRVITTSDVIDLVKYEEQNGPQQVRRRADAQGSITAPSLGQDIASRESDIKAVYAKDNKGNPTNKIVAVAYDTANDPNVIVHTGSPATPELLADEEGNPMMTGIEDLITDGDAQVRYFNLQGIRIFAPVKGQIYLRCTGDKVEKILF